MKKVISLVLTVVIIVSATLCVSATNDEIKVYLDGQKINFDVQPQSINDRTMVPLRAIFEALGASVNWDESTQTITSIKSSTIIKMTIESPIMYVNDTIVVLDSPACLFGERTLVPVRAVSEAFGLDVEWIESQSSVLITSVNSNKDDNTVLHNKYSFDPTRVFKIECTSFLRGTQANLLVLSENQFNDEPQSGQEWIFMEFEIEYISSSGGDNDEIGAHDIIYSSDFYTESRVSIPVYDTASFSNNYNGHGIFDVNMFPGSKAKVAIGLLTDKNLGDIMFKIPNKNNNTLTWINCSK